MNIKTTILVWTLAIFSASAQPAQSVPPGQNAPEQFVAVLAQVSAPNGQYTVKLNGTFLQQGNYKKGFAPTNTGQAGDLLCLVLNRDLKTLDSIFIENPLRARMEFPSENGEIGTTTMEYPTQEVLLRFNYTAEMKQLRFMRFNAPGATTEIETIPLVFK